VVGGRGRGLDPVLTPPPRIPRGSYAAWGAVVAGAQHVGQPVGEDRVVPARRTQGGPRACYWPCQPLPCHFLAFTGGMATGVCGTDGGVVSRSQTSSSETNTASLLIDEAWESWRQIMRPKAI
jgi:hypothetical protein